MLDKANSSALTPLAAVRGTSLRSIERTHNRATLDLLFLAMLVKMDEVCGGRNSGDQLAAIAKELVTTYRNLSFETIVLALREGMRSERVYNLTFPQLSGWVDRYLERIVIDNTDNHLSTRG